MSIQSKSLRNSQQFVFITEETPLFSVHCGNNVSKGVIFCNSFMTTLIQIFNVFAFCCLILIEYLRVMNIEYCV